MSQFASLFETDTKIKTEPKEKTRSVKKKPVASPPTAKSEPPPKVKTEKRAAGKSSNPDYAQVLSYVRRDTHNAVKAALIFDPEKRNLSDLVEELLAGWLKNQK